MNTLLFSRRLLTSFCAAALLLGSAVFLQAGAAAQSASAPVADDASTVPVFYPFTDSQGAPITSVAGRVGQSFTYQTAADNSPTGYSATGLPDGVTIDPASGLISGIPTADGTFAATLSATNASGVGTATLTLVIAPPLPTVTVTASVPSAYPAQGILGSFLITRSGDTSGPLTVTFFLKGSATNGSDYVTTKLTKNFKAGKATKRVIIYASDESGKGITKKTVKLVLQPDLTAYTLGDATTAKVKIFYTP